ncbi:hypothetical protein H5410_051589 [Solanum commersonii]|uniref:Uncharacterized protein n=1 Tax=Solanum commersonii TaxID=4109 RepID=A0A9J5WYW4_SOLCO|nr:hypothetical protein H5410_051589 [Solanum commersonii]
MHVFTHRFSLIFQLTFDPTYSRSKRAPLFCNMVKGGLLIALLDFSFSFLPQPQLRLFVLSWLFTKPQIKRIIGSRSSKV